MNFVDHVREKCMGCEYARPMGCLNADKRRGIHIRGWDCGVTVRATSEGTIFYYQDISVCPRWKNKKRVV